MSALGQQELARLGRLGNSRRAVDGGAVPVAVARDRRARVDPDPDRREAELPHLRVDPVGKRDRLLAVRGADHHRVPDRLDELAVLLLREVPHQRVEADRQVGRAVIAIEPGVLGVTAEIREEEGVERNDHAP